MKTARASGIVVAAMVALTFTSVPFLHWGQRTLGFNSTPVRERAWVIAPEQVGANGIKRGDLLSFDVSIPSRRPIGWLERTDGVEIASGVITGTTGAIAHVTVRTEDARLHHWISIWIDGIHVPLKVWVAN